MNSESSRTPIAQLLIDIRGGLSQSDFSRKIGAAKTTVVNYEMGHRLPDVDFLVSVSNATGADLAELLRARIESGDHQPREKSVLDTLSDLGIINRGRFETVPAPSSTPDPARLRLAITLAEDAAAASSAPMSPDHKADLVMTFYMRLENKGE